MHIVVQDMAQYSNRSFVGKCVFLTHLYEAALLCYLHVSEPFEDSLHGSDECQNTRIVFFCYHPAVFINRTQEPGEEFLLRCKILNLILRGN